MLSADGSEGFGWVLAGVLVVLRGMLVRHHDSGESLCRYVREVSGDTAILSFSAGKDAVASWLALRAAGFVRIVPFYLYSVPGLEFVEQGLRYYEDVFGTTILRLPHPSLLRMLRNLVFQPPERAAILDQMDLPNLRYPQLEDRVRADAGAPDAFVAIGARVADSPIRRANVTRYGCLTPSRRSFMPVFDWSIERVRSSIRAANMKLTVDYRLFGRSFDGIDARFLGPIREYSPDDYERILQWFPLARLELARRHLGEPAHGKTEARPIDSRSNA